MSRISHSRKVDSIRKKNMIKAYLFYKYLQICPLARNIDNVLRGNSIRPSHVAISVKSEAHQACRRKKNPS